MAVAAREVVPMEDMENMSQVNKRISENLICVENEVLILGDKLFGDGGGIREPEDAPTSIMGYMNDNLYRAQKINDLLGMINRMV